MCQELSALWLWWSILALGGGPCLECTCGKMVPGIFSSGKKKGKKKIVLKGERLMFTLLSHTWFGANEVV